MDGAAANHIILALFRTKHDKMITFEISRVKYIKIPSSNSKDKRPADPASWRFEAL